MNIKKREERNREVFLYRTGLDGTVKHTLFESALHFDISVNQIFRIEKDFLKQVTDLAINEGVGSAVDKYALTEAVVKHMISMQAKRTKNLEEKKKRNG